jgi:hypothetical protein
MSRLIRQDLSTLRLNIRYIYGVLGPPHSQE